jgi:hypothetical protein
VFINSMSDMLIALLKLFECVEKKNASNKALINLN